MRLLRQKHGLVKLAWLIALSLVLSGPYSGAAMAQNSDPPPTLSVGEGSVTPSPLRADLRTLLYIPPSAGPDVEFRPQPSLFKWAAQLKSAGTTQPEVPMAPTANMPAPLLTFNAMNFISNGNG